MTILCCVWGNFCLDLSSSTVLATHAWPWRGWLSDFLNTVGIVGACFITGVGSGTHHEKKTLWWRREGYSDHYGDCEGCVQVSRMFLYARLFNGFSIFFPQSYQKSSCIPMNLTSLGMQYIKTKSLWIFFSHPSVPGKDNAKPYRGLEIGEPQVENPCTALL